MSQTTIQWTDYTVNFWWGCTKVSPACAHCYAESWAKFVGKKLFGAPVAWGPGQPRAERLEAARAECLALEASALKKGVRFKVFINSMSDWLDAEVPIAWLAYLLETLMLCPNLDFQLLTKRPENWSGRLHDTLAHAEGITGDWPDREPVTAVGEWINQWLGDNHPSNVWIGTTVESQEWADKRIPHLLAIPAVVRFLSCEPLLGPLNFVLTSEHITQRPHPWANRPPLGGIHWVIAGGESGPGARPTHPDWFYGLQAQCATAGVPFFFKQHGAWIFPPHLGKSFDDFPKAKRTQVWTPTGPAGSNGRKGYDMVHIGRTDVGRELLGTEHNAFPVTAHQPIHPHAL